MSLASEYAATQATAGAGQSSADATVPPPFVGPNGSMSVTPLGYLRVSPGPGSGGELILPAAQALLAAQWIIDTFGGA